LQVESTREAPILLKVLESRAWWRLAPDQKHEFVTSGYGTWKQADYVTAALADDHSLGLAYLPNTRPVQVNLQLFPKPVTAQWFDPSTGKSWPDPGSPFKNSARRELTPPDRSGARETDWVLVVETR
jgi:hypothetical protein